MWYLGIDGGGSKCRAAIATSDGQVIGEGVGGPANPLYGFRKTLDSILDASGKALKQAGLEEKEYSQLIAGVGLAGVNLPRLYRRVCDWQHPFAKLFLTTDLDIANIGAHDGGDGAVIIVGTGSCGFVNSNGSKAILGGHGFPVGDRASGAWFGLEAIKQTLLVLDGFAVESSLANQVCSHFSVTNALALSEQVAGRSSQEYAKIASLVFKCADNEDVSAQAIVDEGINYISEMITMLLEKQPARICMIGGLAQFILPRLSSELAEHFVEPIQQPEIGALHYAEKEWRVINKQSA